MRIKNCISFCRGDLRQWQDWNLRVRFGHPVNVSDRLHLGYHVKGAVFSESTQNTVPRSALSLPSDSPSMLPGPALQPWVICVTLLTWLHIALMRIYCSNECHLLSSVVLTLIISQKKYFVWMSAVCVYPMGKWGKYPRNWLQLDSTNSTHLLNSVGFPVEFKRELEKLLFTH